MLSEFNKTLVAKLGEKIPGFAYREATKNVMLYGKINSVVVNFASLRSGASKKADVWLKGFMPGETTLVKKQLETTYPDGKKGAVFFRSNNVELSADAVERHFKDVVKRVTAYHKTAEKNPGFAQPKRGIGIPSDYFKA